MTRSSQGGFGGHGLELREAAVEKDLRELTAVEIGPARRVGGALQRIERRDGVAEREPRVRRLPGLQRRDQRRGRRFGRAGVDQAAPIDLAASLNATRTAPAIGGDLRRLPVDGDGRFGWRGGRDQLGRKEDEDAGER